jgi:hypothetical protein
MKAKLFSQVQPRAMASMFLLSNYRDCAGFVG